MTQRSRWAFTPIAAGPTYPGLLDRAQQPFQAVGLRVPSYVAFGNHDGLYQGTTQAAPGLVTPGATFEDTAIDCLKPVYPLSNQDSASGLFTPDFLQSVFGSDPTKVMAVPPDINRQFVDHPQFKNIFAAGSQPDDHGFAYVEGPELQGSRGHAAYYSFRPRRGVRFIILDTLAEAGTLVAPTSQGSFASGSEGNLDNPQFQWLQRELNQAERRDELVVAFGHHAISSLTVEVPDETARCTGSQRFGHDLNPSCDLDPRSSTPVHTGPDVRNLFLSHPHLVAYVAGHSHENRIQAFENRQRQTGFWEIKTPAIADFPPQHRLLEVMDNRDGTLSIFATLLDFDAPVGTPPSGTNVGGADLGVLGAIGRAITYNDPQQGPGKGAEGEFRDRNVELLLRTPLRSGQRGRCANLRLGSRKRDRLRGTRQGDRMRGRGGKDVLRAYRGRDCVGGGRGRDRLKGGPDRDVLRGGKGRDRIFGGKGRDRIFSRGDARDRINCGRGRDFARVDPRDRVRGCERVRRSRR